MDLAVQRMGDVEELAVNPKVQKYSDLSNSYGICFVPLGSENLGAMNTTARELNNGVGHKVTDLCKIAWILRFKVKHYK